MLVPPASAELSPAAYEEMRAKAPEEIELLISTAADEINLDALSRSAEEHSVTALAEMVGLKRSQSRLKVGDSIRLECQSVFHRVAGDDGPGPVTIVQQGRR